MSIWLLRKKATLIYRSKLGYPALSDKTPKEVDVGEYDVVIIPGGYAPDIMRRHPAMVKLVADAYNAGRVVAAICHGGWMLASAEILRGKKVTSFYAIKDDLIHAGGIYLDEPVVVDGKLITSRTPDDLPAFMGAVLNALGE